MMLKKQTVWLLTMLSLVVVLSVYYVTSPEGGGSDLVMTGDDKEVSEKEMSEDPVAKEEQPAEEEKPVEEEQPAKEEQPIEEDKDAEKGADKDKGDESKDNTGTDAQEGQVQTEELEDGTVISSISSEELFAELRLELDDHRSKVKEELGSIVANSEASANEKSEAKDEMEALNKAAQKEVLLETLIRSHGYDDALVRADGNNVKITVKAKEHDKSSANKIMALVTEEMENMGDVIVTFKE